ncbi:hypothetical protein LEMLEM_LOCUS15401 [Lemmus lemmus]
MFQRSTHLTVISFHGAVLQCASLGDGLPSYKLPVSHIRQNVASGSDHQV